SRIAVRTIAGSQIDRRPLKVRPTSSGIRTPVRGAGGARAFSTSARRNRERAAVDAPKRLREGGQASVSSEHLTLSHQQVLYDRSKAEGREKRERADDDHDADEQRAEERRGHR